MIKIVPGGIFSCNLQPEDKPEIVYKHPDGSVLRLCFPEIPASGKGGEQFKNIMHVMIKI